MDPSSITILVPQGAEYQAIRRGLRRVQGCKPRVLSIPMGPEPVQQYLHQCRHEWKQQMKAPQVLLMGLCGSLADHHTVGDLVLYRDCLDGRKTIDVPRLACHHQMTMSLAQRLASSVTVVTALTCEVTVVTALTCDRIIHRAADKQQLAQTYHADVVDMEGFAALEVLQQFDIPVAMLRVVSDDAKRDLPDLTAAMQPNGQLQPLPLTLNMLRQPGAATRLIQGSLRGLRVLEQVTAQLFL